MWNRRHSFWLLTSLLACSIVRADTVESWVQKYKQALGAYDLEVKIRTDLQRSLMNEKVYRDSRVQFDAQGRWHLLKTDPIQNDRWEIYSLGADHEKIFLRKNQRDFRFANDPIELRRWLETALRDFYQLVMPEYEQWQQQKSLPPLKQQKITGMEAQCAEWQNSARQIKLCFYQGVIVAGQVETTENQSAGDYPLVTHLEAALTMLAVGDAVKPVSAPLIE